MMEYDPKYADRIIRRWETETGQKAIKINGQTKRELKKPNPSRPERDAKRNRLKKKSKAK